MLSLLRTIATSAPVYVRIKKNWLSVRNAATGKEFQDKPQVALIRKDSGNEIVSIGSHAVTETGNPEVQIINGFYHPRSIINDFAVAEKTLMHFLMQILDNKIIRPSPILIMHIQEELEGGLTQVEVRAIQELGAGAGGREVYIWEGNVLSDVNILNKVYPPGNWVIGPPK